MGWVSDQDYRDDVIVSAMWPEVLRNMYYKMSPALVKKGQKSPIWGYLFFGTAFLYIHAINGVGGLQMGYPLEAWKLIAWPGFLLGVIPTFLVGLALVWGNNGN